MLEDIPKVKEGKWTKVAVKLCNTILVNKDIFYPLRLSQYTSTCTYI